MLKKKIAILGSTGSIGRTLINIIRKDKKNFKIVLLSADKNYKELLKQAKFFKVKNLILTNKDSFTKINKDKYSKKIRIFNNFNNFNKIFKKKIDYTMSSISGIDGLDPTYKIIKHTDTIAIANKEAIICGWNLLEKKLKKFKTKFIPVDSEHFSTWFGIKNFSNIEIDKVILTASGGPFLKLNLKKFINIKLDKALDHPNWKMGNKISIDSATMMNKVFEIIEAKNIFNIRYKNLSILTQPSSYVHSIIRFKNGMSKIIVHDTNMSIPIFNTLYSSEKSLIKFNKLDLKKLNNLELDKIDLKKFPVVKILKTLPDSSSLYETVLVSANDKLVSLFINKKISFLEIQKNLFKVLNNKQFKRLKKIKPKSIKEIINLNHYVHSKIEKLIYN